ncbi:hypothetical protein [Nannocystis radixulma]|uniref:PEGA domain-containing protein n=1 Tax=Nannocystis radixulma TaxID=2995305 RepID=A0ABT5B088_9BACT|nr:hypothetical protein [Nannocystis radixulma]MDC0666944.1 hypothetical protein [Nannocystis radixulma]
MGDVRAIVADSWTAAVALALVVGGLPQSARAEPASGPVEPTIEEMLAQAVAEVDAEVKLELPTELVAPPVPALAEARQLEADLRFAEAARIYEAQWQATGDARFLYHAAVAHGQAGHHAVARRLYEQCQTTMHARGALSQLAGRWLDLAIMREALATKRVYLTLVESLPGGLTAVPPGTLAARTVLRKLGAAGEAVPGDSFEISGRLPDELRLDPGSWSVQVEVPGFVPQALQIVVGDGSPPWQIVLYRRKIVVDLRFSPERALRGAQLKLQAVDHPSPFALARPLLGPTTTVTLTPGAWRLQVDARRHVADVNLAIGTGMGPIDVTLYRRRPVDDQRLVRDRKLVVGLLGTFAATYATSIVLLVLGASVERKAEKRDAAAYKDAGLDPEMPGEIEPATAAAIEATYPAAQLHRDLTYSGKLHAAGTVVAGVGLGALLAALPVAVRAQRRAAVIELGFGAAMLAGGGGWLGYALGERERLLADPDQRVLPSRLDRSEGHRIAAGLFTGVGLGLVVFSGVVLARDVADRRKRARAITAAPWAAPGLAGWSLAGRF